MKWQKARLILEKVHPQMRYRYEGDFWVKDEPPEERKVDYELSDGVLRPVDGPTYLARPTNLRAKGIPISYQAGTVQLLDEYADDPPTIDLEKEHN